MKMLRKIIKIDEDKCNGCGLCVSACAEGALQIVNGKAKLVSESYCDGLGACIGDCPENALIIEEREVNPFDEIAVEKHQAEQSAPQIPNQKHEPLACGCPGSAMRTFQPSALHQLKNKNEPQNFSKQSSQLRHWPVQLMLVPPTAPFLKGADLLICADCVPFAFPNFHSEYLKDKAVLVGCPKLDNLEYYAAKLKEIFAFAKPSKVTVLRMEVPCCGGIAQAVVNAAQKVNPTLPVEIHTIGIQGELLKCENLTDQLQCAVG